MLRERRYIRQQARKYSYDRRGCTLFAESVGRVLTADTYTHT